MNSMMICQKLRHFQFDTLVPMSSGYVLFGRESPVFFSSTLLELHLTVHLFDECLFLLDGRFSQLRVLVVTTARIYHPQRTMINKVSLREKTRSTSESFEDNH